MGFDKRWESILAQQEWGKYPCEDVIRVTARHFYGSDNRSRIKILDLGCGGGATTWYLSREGFDVIGVDGSPSAIRQTRQLLKKDNFSAELMVSDFINLDFPDDFFDAVYDLDAIQHNVLRDIQQIYDETLRVLKPGGLFFSQCISENTSGRETADEIEPNTYNGLSTLNQNVRVHLFSKAELMELTQGFERVSIDTVLKTIDGGKMQIGHYLVMGYKTLAKETS